MAIDYSSSSLVFRLQKATRYLRLYGVSRTWAKIRAQYHLRQTGPALEQDWINAECRDPGISERNIGIIGCGNFAHSCIAYYAAKYNGKFLRATFDADGGRAISLCREFKGAKAVARVDDLINDPQIKLVFVASNHASHADYAVACLNAGKHVHVEKPHVVRPDQLDALLAAKASNPHCKIFLGFNRPRSVHFVKLRAELEKQPGPMMINWFVAGHEIPADHWYFSPTEGGRVLGNLCHWTDLSLQLVGAERAFPVQIIPSTPPDSKSEFVVSLNFADGSVAAITFSAMGHTFEGVREILNVHRGDALIAMKDFESTTIDISARRKRTVTWQRDHGHGDNIRNSLEAALEGAGSGESLEYIRATARLFLEVRRALESGQRVVLEK